MELVRTDVSVFELYSNFGCWFWHIMVQLQINRGCRVVQASGRTDRGVHAARQYVQFFVNRQLERVDKLHLRMNSLLPNDLRLSLIHI